MPTQRIPLRRHCEIDQAGVVRVERAGQMRKGLLTLPDLTVKQRELHLRHFPGV